MEKAERPEGCTCLKPGREHTRDCAIVSGAALRNFLAEEQSFWEVWSAAYPLTVTRQEPNTDPKIGLPERFSLRRADRQIAVTVDDLLEWDVLAAKLREALMPTPEALAEALCNAMPHPGGGSLLVYEDALEATRKALMKGQS